MGAAGRWRRDHRPHVRLVASGMPSGRMRPASACQGRQAREGGGGSGASHHAGGALPALPCAEGLRVPSRPHRPSHEARPEGPRQGRVGAHHVGRGVRPDLHHGERGQGDVRPGGHHGLRRHRPHRLHLLSHDRPQRVRHAQCVLRAKRHGLLLSSRHRNGLRRGKRLSRDRLRQPLSRPLRPSRLGAAQVHPGVGQGAAQVQSRRPVGAFRRRPHEAGLEGDLRRSARDVARLAGGHGPAAASRHGRRPGHGHGERRDPGRPVRPRLRRPLGVRVRRVRRTRGGDDPRKGRRDHLGPGGAHPRGRPQVRDGQTFRPGLGPGSRPERERPAGGHGPHRASVHHRQPRRPGRLRALRRVHHGLAEEPLPRGRRAS